MGARLAAVRKHYNLTLEQMGESFGVGGTTIQGWECGRNQIDAVLLAAVAQKMGFTTDWVLLGTIAAMPYGMAIELQRLAALSLDAPEGEKRGRGRPRKSTASRATILA